MKPVAQTPTETVDYAALTTLYGALLGATAVTARGREPVAREEVPVLGLVALRLHAPRTGRSVATVLAATAGNDMLHAAFQWLCAGANTQGKAAAPRPVELSRSAA